MELKQSKDEIKDKEMKAMEDEGTPCSSFFQQQGAIDYKNYLRLKMQELKAIGHYRAAVRIQAAWRGFLIRENMKILHASAIKIQALMRRALARIHYGPRLSDRLQQIKDDKLNKAATKIQAAWRGFLSRKNSFDFNKYKELMKKNMNLQQSIKKINELESVLMKQLHLNKDGEDIAFDGSSSSLNARFGSVSSFSSSTLSIPFAHGFSEENGSLDDLVRTSFNELSKSMSKCRIEELLTYVKTKVPDPTSRNKRTSSVSSIRTTSLQGENLRSDSVDDLFPEFPDEEDLVRPDSEKVESLKTAIRLLREKIKGENTDRLKKNHFLLRTKNCPGVYSNIYSNELTDIEKELKETKFWHPEELNVNGPSRKKPSTGDSKTNPSLIKDDSIRNVITSDTGVKNVGMHHGRAIQSSKKYDPLTSIRNDKHVSRKSKGGKSERPYPPSEQYHPDHTFNTPLVLKPNSQELKESRMQDTTTTP